MKFRIVDAIYLALCQKLKFPWDIGTPRNIAKMVVVLNKFVKAQGIELDSECAVVLNINKDQQGGNRLVRRYMGSNPSDTGCSESFFNFICSIASEGKTLDQRLGYLGITKEECILTNDGNAQPVLESEENSQEKHRSNPLFFMKNLAEVFAQLDSEYPKFIDSVDVIDKKLYVDHPLIEEIIFQLTSRRTFFISGRWGTGKTILLLEIMQRLVEEGKRVAYISGNDVDDDSFDNLQAYLNSIPSPPILVVDSGHAHPTFVFRLIIYARVKRIAVIIASRPIAKHERSAYEYFPSLFEVIEHQNGRTAVASLQAGLRDQGIELKNPLPIATYLIRQRFDRLATGEQISQVECEKLFHDAGSNLNYLCKHLNWPTGFISKKDFLSLKKNEIFVALRKDYCLDDYPQMYTIAAIHFFDMPAYISNNFFKSEERLQSFVAEITHSKGRLHGKLRFTSTGRLIGFNPSEAFLIMEVGRLHLGALQIADRPQSFPDAFATLLKWYCQNRPFNIFRVLVRVVQLSEETQRHLGITREQMHNAILELYFKSKTKNSFIFRLNTGSVKDLYYALWVSRIVYPGREIILKIFSQSLIHNVISSARANRMERNQPFRFSQAIAKTWHELISLEEIQLANNLLEEFTTEEIRNFYDRSFRSFTVAVNIARYHINILYLFKNDFPLLLERFYSQSLTNANCIRWLHIIRWSLKIPSPVFQNSINRVITVDKAADLIEASVGKSGQLYYYFHRIFDYVKMQELDARYSDVELYSLVYSQQKISNFHATGRLSVLQMYFRKAFKKNVLAATLKECSLFFRNIINHGFTEQDKQVIVDNVLLHLSLFKKKIEESEDFDLRVVCAYNLCIILPNGFSYIDQLIDVNYYLKIPLSAQSLSSIQFIILNSWAQGHRMATGFEINSIEHLLVANSDKNEIKNQMLFAAICHISATPFRQKLVAHEKISQFVERLIDMNLVHILNSSPQSVMIYQFELFYCLLGIKMTEAANHFKIATNQLNTQVMIMEMDRLHLKLEKLEFFKNDKLKELAFELRNHLNAEQLQLS